MMYLSIYLSIYIYICIHLEWRWYPWVNEQRRGKPMLGKPFGKSSVTVYTLWVGLPHRTVSVYTSP